jgi:hypothetical protein
MLFGADNMSRDSIVGVTTGYRFEGPGFETGCGKKFSPLHTGPAAKIASSAMGTAALSRG